MMETPNTLHSGMCRCCSSEGTFKDIKTKYHWMGEEEVYAEMLTDCFDIKIQTPEDMDNGICEVCITQLRNAVNFKKQVLHTEEQFKRRLQGRDVKNPIKIESVEDPNDSDHLSDPDFTEEYEVPIKQEVEEKPKAKKRQAKPATPRAKKAKTEAESSQRDARRTRIITIDATNQKAGIKLDISRNVLRLPKVGPSETRKNLHNLDVLHESPVLKVEYVSPSDDETMPFITSTTSLHNQPSAAITVEPQKPSKRATLAAEMAKHDHNFEIILRHSNATPIRGHFDTGYVCFFCTLAFPDPTDLKTHTLNSHNDIKPKRSLRSEHYSVKIDITNLTCKICLSNYAQLTDFMHHLQVDHDQLIHTDIKNYFLPFRFDSGNVKCASCEREFTAFRNAVEHMKSHYRNYVCDICDAGYVTHANLRTHQKTHENGDNQCKECNQVYNTKSKLANHIRSVHKGQSKRYKCVHCGEKFCSLVMKNNHLVKKHGVAPKRAKCTACDKVFSNNSSLRTHYTTFHLMIKRFKCSLCNMEFSYSHDLNRHMLKHTGNRDFKCDICQKAYARKSTLTQHMMIHNNDRRYKCDHCEMAFVQKCTLNSHIRAKHK
ncbi:zinc finger protein 875-like isoform X3 [Cydia splendana]|uniref:zinc finger protein 875-like isoform X3 n=1 Tax=Cydia splendana TaxID=1100963 RepID=UPI00300D9E5C